MALPGTASLATYGGALNDYGAVRDSSTDRSATGMNPALADTAAMTHTAVRAWARFTINGSSAPSFTTTNAHDEMWNNGLNAAPTIARTGAGIFTTTFPATVYDAIPSTSPGATPTGFAVSLRAAWCNAELGSTTNYDVSASVTAPNVIMVKIFTIGTSTLVDPSDGTVLAVFAV